MAQDWDFILKQSGRVGNFTILLGMSTKAWWIGYGISAYFGEGTDILYSLGGSYMDSLYASTMFQTGIIGVTLFFGSISVCLLQCFRGIAHMTKMQRAAAALSTLFFYYSLFEKGFYAFSWNTFAVWVICVAVTNERDAEAVSHITHPSLQTYRYTPKPRRILA